MRIGQLAERTGLSQRTLRCYEEIGVIGRPRRTQSGCRDYEVLGLEAATGGDEEVFRALVLARLQPRAGDEARRDPVDHLTERHPRHRPV